MRFRYDNNYFDHAYQGIPIGGYTAMIGRILEGIDVRLSTDYLDDREGLSSIARRVVYTGSIDRFYDCKLGVLDYRSLRFEHEILEADNYQGVAGMNYTDVDTPFTRIVEHKHFEFGNGDPEKNRNHQGVPGGLG